MSKRLLVAVAMAAALTAVTVGGSGIAGAQKNAKVDPDARLVFGMNMAGGGFSQRLEPSASTSICDVSVGYQVFGTLIRLADQDRALWDRGMIAEGHALVRACLRRNQPGPFQIQAAIAAVHADAATAEDTDWAQIVALYDLLTVTWPNSVVALNRVVAIAELQGADAGLAALASLDATALDEYQPYHATRADLLARAGDVDAARAAYARAIDLSANVAERRFLEARCAALGDS